MKKMYDGSKRIILFGSGQIGKNALELLGAENVAFFVDNAVTVTNQRSNRKFNIEVISFLQYLSIYTDYITIITANSKNEEQIAEQLLSNGINQFFYIEEIIGIFNPDKIAKFNLTKTGEIMDWKKNALQTIKDRISLRHDKNSEVEFYLVDSFEISHFLPLYNAINERGINVRFVAEVPAINSAGNWFDYQTAIKILQREEIDYCTLRNPKAKLAFTTQFADNLKYYSGMKCQIAYGVAIMKEKAFQLKKDVSEKFDYIFVHGSLQKEIISKWISSSRIIDMSYPRYLHDFEEQIDKQEIIKELNIKTEKPIIVYYPTWDEYSSIQKYEKAFCLLRKEFFIISKPHHCLWHFKEKVDALYRLSDLVLDNEYSLYKAAKITDCAICDAKSGVVTELAFLNSEMHMVLIHYNTTNKNFYIDLEKFADGIRESSALYQTLKNVLYNDEKIPFRKNMINRMYSPNIREGVERAINTITELI